MKILSSANVLSVKDVQSSLNFYKNVLGAKDYFSFGDYAGVLLGLVEIHLAGPSVDLRRNEGHSSIYFFCENVDEYYKDFSSKGAKIAVALDNQPYSMRDFVIEDLDGNLLTFGQEIDKEGKLIFRSE
jgi:uncharacterized glyoxalase superfamily protein PhnB